MPCPRAPTSRNPFVCRFNVACTPAQPQSGLASHNFQQGRTRSSSATRATSTAHLLCNARRTCTSHTTASAAVGAQRIRPAALLPACCHCPATPAMPRPTSCCALLCRPRALYMRSVHVASQSQWLLGPPGHLLALAVRGGQRVHRCVCDVRQQSCPRVGCRLLFSRFRFRLFWPVSTSSRAAPYCSPSVCPACPSAFAGDMYDVRCAALVLVEVLCRIRSGRLSVAVRLLSLSVAPAGVLANHTIHHTPHPPH
jgi:hypothetical protein